MLVFLNRQGARGIQYPAFFINCAIAAVFPPGAAHKSRTISPDVGFPALIARYEARSCIWKEPDEKNPAKAEGEPVIMYTPGVEGTLVSLAARTPISLGRVVLPRFLRGLTRRYLGRGLDDSNATASPRPRMWKQ